ncbi:hypothetical protein AN958_10087 [Leucoagaricus sp. SymC.cos]|nr:hypothetical protein AN958_10087 [Leucoagaricus sp. SymC.cos]
MCNSRHSDTVTVWFDVWDSQSGANIKKLNGQYITISSPGVPLCQCCWCWGHPTNACKTEAIHCPCCSGPHSEKHYQEYASCCKSNPKADPPIPPIIVDVDCLHIPICSNCCRKHVANNHKCKFWHCHFDANWFSR